MKLRELCHGDFQMVIPKLELSTFVIHQMLIHVEH